MTEVKIDCSDLVALGNAAGNAADEAISTIAEFISDAISVMVETIATSGIVETFKEVFSAYDKVLRANRRPYKKLDKRFLTMRQTEAQYVKSCFKYSKRNYCIVVRKIP